MQLTSFYLKKNAYYTGFVAVLLFVLSYFAPVLFTLAIVVLICLAIALLLDVILLYSEKNGITAQRTVTDRWSNGDENIISIYLHSAYGFKVICKIIDEIPYQFQQRNWYKVAELSSNESNTITYFLQPSERGIYDFGSINIYAESPLHLVIRRYRFVQPQTVRVYPSYMQMRRYELIATASHMPQTGTKRMRKLGHSMEFEQIKEYVRGDDYRTINWTATARRGDMMANSYTDERSQQVYCLINKGRVMKMPFDNMTLLDYAINAALAVSNIAVQKHDKAGLITFAERIDAFILADKKPGQINTILEQLYKEQTTFSEPDLEQLFSIVRNRITNRSLLILFTNFESYESFNRQLPFLKLLAHYHLLLVVFFENTEVKKVTETKATTIEGVYIKTIAEKYIHEKRQMVKTLQQNGIVVVLSTPQDLSIKTLNKYLELKQRQVG